MYGCLYGCLYDYVHGPIIYSLYSKSAQTGVMFYGVSQVRSLYGSMHGYMYNYVYGHILYAMYCQTPDAEEMSMVSVQLSAKFLFNIAFHTKKSLRGLASDWYDALGIHLRHSRQVRNWFAQHALFAHPGRFSEYLLECPSTEVGDNV